MRRHCTTLHDDKITGGDTNCIFFKNLNSKYGTVHRNSYTKPYGANSYYFNNHFRCNLSKLAQPENYLKKKRTRTQQTRHFNISYGWTW